MRLGLALAVAAVTLAFALPAHAATLIKTVAGTGTFAPTPDGTAALEANIDPTNAIAALRSGTTPKNDYLVYDAVSCAIRRVSNRTKTISTVAGGDCGFDPGGPYSGANPLLIGIGQVNSISATADNGGFLFAHDGWVEKWDPASATVTTVAGIPACNGPMPAGVASIAAPNCSPIFGLVAHPTDPNRYLVGTPDAIFDVSGSTATYAAGCSGSGKTLLCPGGQNPEFRALVWANDHEFIASDIHGGVLWRVNRVDAVAPFVIAGGGIDPDGEGGPATSASLGRALYMARGWDGSLYFTDEKTDNTSCRILRVSALDGTGTLSRIAGLPVGPADPTHGCGNNGDATVEATKAQFNAGPLAMTPLGLLVIDYNLWKVRMIERTSILDGPPRFSISMPVASWPWTSLTQATFKIDALDANPIIRCVWQGGGGLHICTKNQLIQTAADGAQFLIAGEGNAPQTDPGTVEWYWINDLAAPQPFNLLAPADGADHVTAAPDFTFEKAVDPDVTFTILSPGGSGVQRYELWVDGKKAASGPCCTLKPDAALGEGKHTWLVKAVDAAGNTGTSAQRSFIAGGNPPAASFSVAPNPALVGRAVTFTNTSTDPDGGSGTKWEWDLDGDGSFESQGETVSRSYDAPGDVPVTLRVTDATGLSATSTQTVKVTAQAISGQLGVTINNGAQYTRTPNVTITANFPSTVTQVLVSNDGGFLAGTPIQPRKTFSWKLDSSGPERLPKIVYVRFLSGGITSETYTDDIILDETPPKVEQASLQRGPTAAVAARLQTWKLKVRASDSNSGVARMQVTANKKKPGRLLAYKTKLTIKSAAKPRFARAQDRAGNFSPWKKIR